jgi:hypothetical protein
MADPAALLAEAEIPFALAPALANNGIIDYSTPAGIKLYLAAIKPLQTDLFGCEAHNVKTFLSALEDRSLGYGWDAVLDIPLDPMDPLVNTLSLLTQYGRLTLEQVRAHAATYIALPNRAAQDSMQLYTCLSNSISKEAKAKVMIWREDYYVNNLPSGAALLKVLIRESHIDSRATVLHLRSKLSSLDTYIHSIDYDIPKFHGYVKDLLDSLRARGETTQDLLANLFKAYKVVKDREFVAYIRKKEDLYEEGEDINTDNLMLQASNKYKTMVQQGLWNAPSPESEKILALEAKLLKLTSKKKEESKPKEKEKGKDKDKDKKKKGPKPSWKTEEPKDKSKSKTVDGRTYWWCPNHKAFTMHTPQDCRGIGQVTSKPKTAPGSTSAAPGRTLQLNQALTSVMMDEE